MRGRRGFGFQDTLPCKATFYVACGLLTISWIHVAQELQKLFLPPYVLAGPTLGKSWRYLSTKRAPGPPNPWTASCAESSYDPNWVYRDLFPQSNPKSKYVVYLSVLSQISNCQSLVRKNKHEMLKTDRTLWFASSSRKAVHKRFVNGLQCLWLSCDRSRSCTRKGIWRQGIGSFCKESLCFSTVALSSHALSCALCTSALRVRECFVSTVHELFASRCVRERCSERDKWVSTNGVTAIYMLFWQRDLLGTPVNLLWYSQKCQGVAFSPICQNSVLLQRPH